MLTTVAQVSVRVIPFFRCLETGEGGEPSRERLVDRDLDFRYGYRSSRFYPEQAGLDPIQITAMGMNMSVHPQQSPSQVVAVGEAFSLLLGGLHHVVEDQVLYFVDVVVQRTQWNSVHHVQTLKEDFDVVLVVHYDQTDALAHGLSLP
jgi:hypothetical protein